MLVLKRKVGEMIRIGDDIELYVLGIEGDVIKLGIEAPKSTQILRAELYDALQQENMQASQSQSEQKLLLDFLQNNKTKGRE